MEELQFDYQNPDFKYVNGTIKKTDINGNEVEVEIDIDQISLVEDEEHYGEYEVVEVTEEDFDNGNIKCPYTGSLDIYRISDEIYASFETDQPFRIVIV